ncbi:hypothetical protein C2E23DRAFT_885344 [Lenzites betulinus]|nr:hypothetical protein C2E23DRAFT_885344 [Lenzites betulinus]
MPPEPTFIHFTADPDEHAEGPALASNRDRERSEARTLFNNAVFEASGGQITYMRYGADGYAKYIVVKCGLKLEGWPAGVPFLELSKAGGVQLLRELHRRWHLEEGDPERLRFEATTAEDRANAERDPQSAIPNAGLRGREASPTPPLVVDVIVLHPHTLDITGVEHTSTQLAAAANGADVPKPRWEQRIDNKRRHRPLKRPDLKRPPKRGVLSMRSVIAGDWDSSARPGKRAREDCAVDDRIEHFSAYRGGIVGGTRGRGR